MDREYFDAKFDGLEKLVAAQDRTLNNYILAVSTNVKEVRRDLAEHEKSLAAHGIEAGEKNSARIVSWIALGLSVLLGAVDFFHKTDR